MLAGHYATALIAKQKVPKGSLMYFLIMSQLPDLLWVVFHFLGIEPTKPSNILDVSLDQLMVDMIYSHDLLPILVWSGIGFGIGLLLFKSQKVGAIGALLIALHAFIDYIGGYPHNIFGTDSLSVSTGLYYSYPYLAVTIELVFSIIALYWFFATEKKNNVARTKKSRNWIIGIFTFNVLFLYSVASVSIGELLNRMNVNFSPEFGFQTSMPFLLIVYVAYIYLIHRYAKVGSKELVQKRK